MSNPFPCFTYIHWLLLVSEMPSVPACFTLFSCCLVPAQCGIPHLREANDMALLPENTPAARFFKYGFARLDKGDVKSLTIIMKGAYANLCSELYGCDKAEAELDDLYRRRLNELDINTSKMHKFGMLLQRLISNGV